MDLFRERGRLARPVFAALRAAAGRMLPLPGQRFEQPSAHRLMGHPPRTTPLQTSGFALGVAAAGIATAGMFGFGAITEQPTIAEVVAEAIAGLTPIEIIETMISTFGTFAKKLLFLGVLAGQIALGGGLGLLYQSRGGSPREGIAYLAGAVAALALVVLPILGAGVMAAHTRAGAGVTAVGLVMMAVLFGLSYRVLVKVFQPEGVFAEEEAASRRTFLRKAGLTLGGLVVGVSGLRWISDRLTPPPVPPVLSSEVARTAERLASVEDPSAALREGIPGLSPEITPNDKFYVVSKNVFRDPVVDEQSWRLEVAGLVDRPMVLTYEELKALPAEHQYFTLQCISNEVGGDLIGNAQWRGVHLADLLRQSGVKPAAVDVIVRAADDYADSIPIEKAMQRGTMLAYEMNGEVLPRNHGFPTRLLVPDIYGMKNVKWVTKIEVVEYDFKGYWQTRGWSDVATMNTTSRTDLPKNASFLRPGPNYVGGVAVAGQRGIQKVEVSTDGGRTWEAAVVKPALGPNTWVLWLYEWQLPAEPVEIRKILVRATDGTGAVQSSMVLGTLPDGASGYHAIIVRRAEA